jgi:hypothetical protein
MVVDITFLLRLRCPHASWKNVVITISHRVLFAFSDANIGAGCMSLHEEEEGNDENGKGEKRKEQEESVGVGEVEEAEFVLWEEWGPRTARVILPPTIHWIAAQAGRRWFPLEDDKLVMCDFSMTPRVRILKPHAGAGNGRSEVKVPVGSSATVRASERT